MKLKKLYVVPTVRCITLNAVETLLAGSDRETPVLMINYDYEDNASEESGGSRH